MMLTLEQKQEISDTANGTSLSECGLAEIFDCTDDEVLDAIVEINEIERCTTCDWWCELHELELINDEHTCEDCR